MLQFIITLFSAANIFRNIYYFKAVGWKNRFLVVYAATFNLLPDATAYMSHYAKRNNPNITYVRPITKCESMFKKFDSMKAHVSKSHRATSSLKNSHVSSLCTYHCHFETAAEQLIQHLQKHMNNENPVECPFPSCQVKYNNAASFRSHLYRKHKNQSVSDTFSV